MNLVTINLESIQLGQPLPFALRGSDGALLAQKGFVVNSRDELGTMVARGRKLCVDVDESGESYRAYLAQLQRMLMSADTNLGQLASIKMTAGTQPARERDAPPYVVDWPALQVRVTQVLRMPHAVDFPDRFQPLHMELARNCEQAPDATLLALIYLSAQETRMYSGTHAMLVACVCMVVAREVLRWPPMQVHQLAQQTQPLTALQISAVENHAARSEALLHQLGVHSELWLEAVRHHHHRTPGAFAQKSPGLQMARLIQRADVFGARLAPRAARSPMPVTAAMQASYYDEEQKVDEAGAALVKALGIYPPGAFVKLASQEVAVVLRRGSSGTTPRVAVVTNRLGMPTGELIPRDTSQPQWKIVGVVAHKDVRVQLSLNRLLPLV
jgi:hypothetical protein